MIKLDIFSDPICPWCFIGKTNLDRALKAAVEENGTQPFTMTWHPFQLNPTMPKNGMDRRAYLEAKFGGKDAALKAYAPIVEMAEQIGLEMDLGAIERTPNTLDAHRLMHWALAEDKQLEIADALFEAYFQKAQDIGAHSVLIALADSVGMNGDAVGKLLVSEEDVRFVQDRDAEARARGVQAVPTFVVANQHVVPGAQPTDLWNAVIKDIQEQLSQPQNG